MPARPGVNGNRHFGHPLAWGTPRAFEGPTRRRSIPSRAGGATALDLRAESIVEVDAQHLFRANGIAFDAQVQIPGIGRVDFLIEGFLIVEVDGFAFHSTRKALRQDLARNNASTVHGYAVLRYPPEVIWFNPEQVLAEIRAVLASRKASAQ